MCATTRNLSYNDHETRDAGCLRISPLISAQFIFEMCAVAENREKFIKTYYLGVQGP